MMKEKMAGNAATKGADKAMPSHEIDHMRIYEGEDGGHIMETHFKMPKLKGTGAFHDMPPDPEKHVFGKDEGMKAHEHIAEHMNMPMQTGDNETEKEEEEEE